MNEDFYDLSRILTPDRDGSPIPYLRTAVVVSTGTTWSVLLDGVSTPANALEHVVASPGDTVVVVSQVNAPPLVLGAPTPASAWIAWPGAASAMGAAGTNYGSTAVVSGFYEKRGRTVQAKWRLNASGAGVAPGVGNYVLALPVAAKWAVSTDPAVIGHGVYTNSGATIWCPFDVLLNSSTIAVFNYPTTHNGPAGTISGAAPFALAAGSVMDLTLRYESAS